MLQIHHFENREEEEEENCNNLEIADKYMMWYVCKN